MNEKTTTIIADDKAGNRDMLEFRQTWEEPPGKSEVLEPQRRFDTLVGDLSLKFINLPANEIDPEIEDSQRRVCQCLCLDMCSLWQWSDESPGFLALTHLFRSLEGPPTPEPMDAQEYFPWCLKQLLAGKVVAVSSIEDLPAEAARDKESWHRFGIKSTLVIPLSAGGGPLFGALSFNDMKKDERLWSEALVKRLQLVAQIFANAITRKRSDQVLEERLRFERLLADLSAAFINQPPDRIDGIIDDSLKRLLETLCHDRSSLAQFSEDRRHALVTHSCAVPGIEPSPVGVLAEDHVPWIVGQVRNGKNGLLEAPTG